VAHLVQEGDRIIPSLFDVRSPRAKEESDSSVGSSSLIQYYNIISISGNAHFWHLTESPDMSNDSMACDRCLSISCISSKDDSSEGSFNIILVLIYLSD
jgi:hypothetical protein